VVPFVNPLAVYEVPVMPVKMGLEPSPPEVVPMYRLYVFAPDDEFQDKATCPLLAVAVRPVGAAGGFPVTSTATESP